MQRQLIQIVKKVSNYLKLSDGRYVDQRFITNINENYLYKPEQAADILGCSISLIYKICASTKSKKTDPRLMAWIVPQKKYTYRTIASKLNCSESLIRHLTRIGEIERTPISQTFRVPGWSINDYIIQNTFIDEDMSKLDIIKVSTLIRIPGFSIQKYILSNCSDN